MLPHTKQALARAQQASSKGNFNDRSSGPKMKLNEKQCGFVFRPSKKTK